MQNDNIFIIVAVSISFILFGIIYSIGFYELTIDWEMVSSIVVGIYLYLTYLMFSIFFGKNKIRYSQRRMPPQEKNQKAYCNAIYGD